MATREEHIARNDAMTRESNRLHGELALALKQDTVELSCECGRASCQEEVGTTVAQYVMVRSHPRWFFVISGHETRNVETVVDRRDDYFVVEKPEGDQLVSDGSKEEDDALGTRSRPLT